MKQLSYIYTLAEANTIIVILVAIVILLLVLGVISLRYSRIVRQRNEQLRRILNALDDFLFGILITAFCAWLAVNRFLHMTANELYKI